MAASNSDRIESSVQAISFCDSERKITAAVRANPDRWCPAAVDAALRVQNADGVAEDRWVQLLDAYDRMYSEIRSIAAETANDEE